MSDPIRVLSFESRKAKEISSLIERSGGIATVAPAMREIPLGMTDAIRSFHSGLIDGRYGLVIFLTGVGAEALLSAIETEHTREEFLDALERPRVIVRGPKPFAALRKWNVRIDAKAPEPNTWVEVIESVRSIYGDQTAPLAGVTVAVQEYGKPSTELYAGLEQLGASVEPVPVYRWDLPDDTRPIKSAIEATIRGEFDAILFTTAQHIVHVLQVAESMGRTDDWVAAAGRSLIASIGPTASERLRECGLPVDFEPSHPHMGHLVRESLRAAPALLNACRNR
jgi:uroporphyrinogen-III synthase